MPALFVSDCRLPQKEQVVTKTAVMTYRCPEASGFQLLANVIR